MGSPPSLSSACTIFNCPCLAAMCSAVSPFWNRHHTHTVSMLQWYPRVHCTTTLQLKLMLKVNWQISILRKFTIRFCSVGWNVKCFDQILRYITTYILRIAPMTLLSLIQCILLLGLLRLQPNMRHLEVALMPSRAAVVFTSWAALTSAPLFSNISAHFSPSFTRDAMCSGVSLAWGQDKNSQWLYCATLS